MADFAMEREDRSHWWVGRRLLMLVVVCCGCVFCCGSRYSFQYDCCFFFGGISPAGGGIYPSASGRNLDFCLCSIPTVDLYGKLGEIAATH